MYSQIDRTVCNKLNGQMEYKEEKIKIPLCPMEDNGISFVDISLLKEVKSV